MSLQFDTTKCNPPTPANTNENTILEVLALCSMFVGMNAITKDNWKKFYSRVHALELLRGNYLYGGPTGDRGPITEEEVKHWIGMTTNASTLTDAQFSKRMMVTIHDFERNCRD